MRDRVRVFGVVVSLVVFGVAAPDARAVDITVSSLADSGGGTLRSAIGITNADANPDPDTITFSVTGTISLVNPLPAITKNVTIAGPGPGLLIVRSNGVGSVLSVNTSDHVAIAGVTLAGGGGGGAAGNTIGGGLLAAGGGTVALTDCDIVGNSATQGGGIYSNNTLGITLTRSRIMGNSAGQANGIGGIRVSTFTLTDSIVSGNTHGAMDGNGTIERSLVAYNTSGAIVSGSATVRNSTFAGNDVDVRNGTATFASCTLAGSSAAFTGTTSITLRNTIVAGAGTRCGSGVAIVSQGHNLSTDSSCALTGAGDLVATDPLLVALDFEGAYGLLPGSPAVNAGDDSGVATLDQRGQPRVAGGRVDIGAVEMQIPTITMQPTATTVVEGELLMLSVTATEVAGLGTTYQWRKDGVAIGLPTIVAFYAKTATLDDAGSYDVVVSNAHGHVISDAVAVTVTPYVDLATPPVADLATSPTDDAATSPTDAATNTTDAAMTANDLTTTAPDLTTGGSAKSSGCSTSGAPTSPLAALLACFVLALIRRSSRPTAARLAP